MVLWVLHARRSRCRQSTSTGVNEVDFCRPLNYRMRKGPVVLLLENLYIKSRTI